LVAYDKIWDVYCNFIRPMILQAGSVYHVKKEILCKELVLI